MQAEAWKEKQRHFEEKLINKQKIIQHRQIKLRNTVKSHKRSAQTAVEDSERIFTELICLIEKRHSEVKQLIRDQEKAVKNHAERRLNRLELELDEVRCKDAEMTRLSETQDHVYFIQSLSSVSLPGSTDDFTVSSDFSLDAVVKTVSQLKDKLQQFSRETIENISERVKTIQVIGTPEYQTRKEFLQCVSRLVSFGGSVEHSADDSMSLASSDVEDWLCPMEDPSSHLLSHCQRIPCQRPPPFFPEVHDKLTKSWCIPYFGSICWFAFASFTLNEGCCWKSLKVYVALKVLQGSHHSKSVLWPASQLLANLPSYSFNLGSINDPQGPARSSI
ncbi:hypothetical protein Q8A67_001331 [Cirrhinus molitorella]|uniref:TRIM8/14/16/25/29/45/65 coiled-coil region domain-containing protein n=1 Tax=Cirrhinus molitorella TaxID=172907 RepID=A0AA88TXM7_9TELE|nr:hypothetical protein Q8A67_001331 [Cirrhinus molitorella]